MNKVQQFNTATVSKRFTCASFFICMNCSFVLQMSQLNETLVGNGLSDMFMVLGCGFLILHLTTKARVSIYWFVTTLMLLIIGFITFFNSGSPTLLKLILFFYATQKVEKERILKYFMISLIVPGIVVAITSFLGITEIHYLGLKKALSFGMINPNTVPVIIFAIIVAFNLRCEDFLKFRTLVLEMIITFLTFYFCRARTAGIVLILYILMLLIVRWWGEKKIVKIFFYPFQFLFPVCASITIALSHVFRTRTSFWLVVNNISSGRLLAWSRYLTIYGISTWGNNIEFNMGSLDNAYMQLLVRYGVVVFFVYLFMFFFISRFAYRNNRMVLFTSIIATEIYCIAEFGPLLINFCPVLVYLACLLVNRREAVIFLGKKRRI